MHSYPFLQGTKDGRILRGAPKFVPATKRGFVPEHRQVRNDTMHRPEMKVNANIHQVRRVFVVQQRIRPYKFHIHSELHSCMSQDRPGRGQTHPAPHKKTNKPRARCHIARLVASLEWCQDPWASLQPWGNHAAATLCSPLKKTHQPKRTRACTR